MIKKLFKTNKCARVLIKLVKSIIKNDFYGMAAEMGFMLVVGIFPFMLFLMALFGWMGNRSYLDAILRHGLKPKNGGGITRWRNTTPRIYLSLLPDFKNVDYKDDEENKDDTIILRIDLRSVMKNFDFYVDKSYDNAVFTYSNIPPNFIQVISNEEIREHYSEYYLRYAARQALKRIVEKNFSDCDEEEKRRKVYLYSCQIEEIIMPKVVLNYLNLYGVNENYKKYIGTAIKNEVNNYVNS
jgi:hypothetical protein